MTAELTHYDDKRDFERVNGFLRSLYQPENRDGNWLQPIWEYARTHPAFDEAATDRIGLWEAHGSIVGFVTYELRLGEAFFNCARGFDALKPEMLAHAEHALAAPGEDGVRELRCFVPDFDADLRALVEAHGYRREPAGDCAVSALATPEPPPAPALPSGIRLQPLSHENDLRKMDRVLWRGFDHAGEPPADGVEDRRRMQSGPNYRADLAVVAVELGGEFVSFCGMWYDPRNRISYVEPVATDPSYRRQGIGKATVIEGIRRCALEGATMSFVLSTLPIYRSIGFTQRWTRECWLKRWS